jgi:hypothetical protein
MESGLCSLNSKVFRVGLPEAARNRQKEEKMRSKFAMLLAIAAVCVTTAWADWTSESLVTGSQPVTRQMLGSNHHFLVYGTDGVGHLVWQGGPLSLNPYPYNFGIWYNRYNPGSGSRPGSWTTDFAIDPAPKKSSSLRAAPCVALDGDGRTIHVVWERQPYPGPFGAGSCSLRYRRCTQDKRGNDKWDPIQFLQTADGSFNPVVACVPNEPNHVLVCWSTSVVVGSSEYSYVVRFREYVNGAWTQVVTLDSIGKGPGINAYLWFPSITAASNGNVFVAYNQCYDEPLGYRLFVKTRTNGVWGEKVNVAPGFTSAQCPVAKVNPTTGNPHLVFNRRWVDALGDTFEAIYHTFRNALGVWETPEVITSIPRADNALALGHYSMAFLGNGAAYVAWKIDDPSADVGILYSQCSSEGGTWSAPELLTSYDHDFGPFIAAEEPAHSIHAAWGNHVNGITCDEIWWKSYYPGGGGSQAEPMTLSQSRVELFPNPAKAGRVTVHYALPHAGPMTITLLDVSGRAVRPQEVAATDRSGSLSIDVRGLNAGVYVARLVAGDLSVSKSLVVGR